MNVITFPSGSTDPNSGFKEYQFTTTGRTENNEEKTGTKRNIKAEGTSTIKWRACDKLNNCSEWSEIYTVNIDKKDPTTPTSSMKYDSSTGSTRPNSTDWTNRNIWWGNFNASDKNGEREVSGVKEYEYSNNCTGTKTGILKTEYLYKGDIDLKYCIRSVDNAGNKSSWSNPYYFRIDQSKPTSPTIGLYKWKNNSTEPTSSSGLTKYTSNSWSNVNVISFASGSTDSGGSGFAGYQYTTTGRTANDTEKTATKRNIKAEGISKIKWRACDNAGNCSAWSTTYSVNIDKKTPTIPTSTIRVNNSSGATRENKNEWTNETRWWGSYNASDANGSVEVSGVARYEYSSGCTGTKTNTLESSYTYSTNTNATFCIRSVDNAGNASAWSNPYYFKIDKSAPNTPTVGLYQWKNNSTEPTSSSGLTTYTNNTWSTKYVIAFASGGTDSGGSGFKEYQYTTTGRTANNSNTAATKRNIKAQGTSTIKWRACDNVGNCSAWSTTYTINIDSKAPTVPTSVIRVNNSSGATRPNANSWTNETRWWGSFSSSDTNGSAEVSGVDHYEYSTGCSGTKSGNLSTSYTYSTNTNASYCIRAIDKAGNVSVWSEPYYFKIDKSTPETPSVALYKWKNNSTEPTSSSGLTTYTNNSWSSLYVTAFPSGGTDTGGSGFAGYQYTTTGRTTNATAASGSRRSIQAEGTSTIKWRACDNVGNCSNWSDTYTIKIDSKAPTVPTSTIRVNNASGATRTNANSWTNETRWWGSFSSSDTNGSAEVSGVARYEYSNGCSGSKTGNLSSSYTFNENTNLTYCIRAVDNAGNASSWSSAYYFKIDKSTPSVPTIGLYKWKNNSTTPTSSSGLTAYSNGAWSNLYVTAFASGSTDSGGSSLKGYQYTTTGRTTNETTYASKRDIKEEGKSTIKWRACDNAGNCSAWSTTYMINIDTKTPTVPTSVIRVNNASGATRTNSNSWTTETRWWGSFSANDTNGSAEVSGINRYEYSSGCTGSKTANLSSSYTYTGTVNYTFCIRAVDNAGNASSWSSAYYFKVDQNAPTSPTIGLYKWTNNSTEPTNSSGLTAYTNGSWSNKYVTAFASGSTDSGSGLKEYQYTTTGTTTNNSNTAATKRNIKAQGTSYIKWRACDNLGNCSAWSTNYTVKIDSVVPSVPSSTIRVNNATGATRTNANSWTNETRWWGSFSSTDETSGVARYEYSSGCSGSVSGTLSSSYTYDTNTNASYCIRAVDNAGNASSWSSAYYFKIDKDAPNVPTSVVRVNNSSGATRTASNVWTNETRWWGSFSATDTGTVQSGIDHYEYSSKCTGTKTNNLKASYTYNTSKNYQFCIRSVDVAGNASSWSSAYYFKIDKEAPAVPTVGLYKWKDNDTNPSSSSGLTAYTAGTWSALKIATFPSGGADTGGSGFKEYQYTTTGKTTNATETAATKRNVNANGTSTIKWRACDNAGNCSAWSTTYTIKVDRKAPTLVV